MGRPLRLFGSMEYKDYYKILSVDRDATSKDVKRAYQKLARKYHPDVSKEPDAEAHFKEVGEAYAVLKDPEKRAAYDQLGPDWKAGQDFTAPPGWDAGFEFRGSNYDGGMQFASSDFFDALFGQGYRGPDDASAAAGITRGQDHHAKVLIDLEDAWLGGTQKFTLRVPEIDSAGRLRTKQRTIDVRIPKGVKHGQHIRLAGLGAPGLTQGEPGDLYLEVEFKAHRLFRADGHDLYIDLPVAPWEAALGAKVKVPTPAGIVELKIPAGSSGGTRLRLKGRGIPGPTAGDLYAILQIALPPAKTDEAKGFYKDMQKEFAFDPRAHMDI
jgi:curved DNA-binding protein